MAACISRRAFIPYAALNERKQRMHNIRRFNKLFYECVDLTGDELRSITKGRRIQFSQDAYVHELIVHKEVWNTQKDTWDGMANILNTWSVGDQIREKIKDLPDDEYVIKFVVEDNDAAL